MKVTGIELLQGIEDGIIKDGTKYTCGYCHRYVIVYDKEVYWGYSNDFNVNNDIKYKPYNFAFANEKPIFRKLEQFQLMNTTFEIIEEPKEELEEIELLDNRKAYEVIDLIDGITTEYKWGYCDVIQNTKINELIANQNKIVRELKDNKKQ